MLALVLVGQDLGDSRRRGVEEGQSASRVSLLYAGLYGWILTPMVGGMHLQRHEGKRVMECLQKALRIADNCMEGGQNVALFVDLLNKYMYYRAQGCVLVW